MSGAQAKRHFQVATPQEWPEGALSWRNDTEKGYRRKAWRIGIMRKYAEHARFLRVCWMLESLSSSRGYAFPTDKALGKQCGLPVNKVQAVLTELERNGAIVRVHVPNGASFQRRIFLGEKAAEIALDTPHHGGMPTPPTATPEIPPTVGGEKGNRRDQRDGLGATVLAASADARRREARARGETSNAWMFDDGADAA